MTALGRLAIQYGANVLNLQARRSSLEARIARYFSRDFDIALPGLDVARFAMTGRLPYLSGYVSGARDSEEGPDPVETPTQCSCSVVSSELHATSPGRDHYGYRLDGNQKTVWGGYERPKPYETPASSDYALQMTYGDVYRVTLNNVAALADEVRVAGLCAMGEGNCDMFEIQPVIDPKVVCRIIDDCFRDYDNIRLSPLVKMFGRVQAAEIIASYVLHRDVAPIHQLACERVARLPRAEIPFAFMRVEDKTALTGPFPRQVLTPAQWYGSAYYPANVWRKTLGAAIVLTQLRVTPYELLWILQWIAPLLDETVVLRRLENMRKRLAK
jgi:hypothetical protein